MAPAHGFEPWTKWLTATYSTAELCRNIKRSGAVKNINWLRHMDSNHGPSG